MVTRVLMGQRVHGCSHARVRSQESSIMFANLPVHWQPWGARSSEELYLGEEELARLG